MSARFDRVLLLVIPAQAGIHLPFGHEAWVPAFAGTTTVGAV